MRESESERYESLENYPVRKIPNYSKDIHKGLDLEGIKWVLLKGIPSLFFFYIVLMFLAFMYVLVHQYLSNQFGLSSFESKVIFILGLCLIIKTEDIIERRIIRFFKNKS